MLALLGTLAVLQAGDWVLSNAIEGPLAARRATRARREKQIEDLKADLAQAREEANTFALWESQSLPSDPDVARSLYQSWLLELVGKVDFAGPHVDSGTPVERKGLFRSITFSVRGRGTLTQLTEFLFEFYSANHLHQIRSLTITPLKKTGELDLSLSIEALVLPTADRSDQLAAGRSDRLASATLADYAPIVRRNLLGVGAAVDPADQAYLTAVTYSNGQPEAWFILRDVGETVKLHRNDKVTVGLIVGTIVEISASEVVIETGGGERWLLSVGENLGQAFALPPEF
jgi:hypothetical protein